MQSGTVVEMASQFFNQLFGCHHRLSRVFTIRGYSYQVCVECGTRFEYSLDTMSVGRIIPPSSSLASLREPGRRIGSVRNVSATLMPSLEQNAGGKLR